MFRRPLSRRLALSGGAALLATPAGSAGKLTAPIDVNYRRGLVGKPFSPSGCRPPPPPQRNITLGAVYTDKAFSKIDPDLQRRYQEAARPFGIFSTGIARQSDLWLAATPVQPVFAACTLAWLDSWASADAMLGTVTTADAQHQRKWLLAGAAQVYLKIRGAPGLDPARQHRVEAWFGRLASTSRAYYSSWPRTGWNNHIYWYGLALAATAVATGDTDMFEDAMLVFHAAMQDVRADGSLPLEMARRSRALGYHVFSIMALVLIAEFGEANGRRLYAANDGAIHRLAARVQAGLVDSSSFAAQAGAAQEMATINPTAVSWGEPYYARFPNAALGRMIASQRPIFYHWMGGSVTNDYGSADLPFHAASM